MVKQGQMDGEKSEISYQGCENMIKLMGKKNQNFHIKNGKTGSN